MGAWSLVQIEAAEANALWLAGPGELTVWLFGTPTVRHAARAPCLSSTTGMPPSDPSASAPRVPT